MEELIIDRTSFVDGKLSIRDLDHSKGIAEIDVVDDFGKASICLDKTSARQLHEWLGRYLENSNGK